MKIKITIAIKLNVILLREQQQKSNNNNNKSRMNGCYKNGSEEEFFMKFLNCTHIY